MSELVSFYVTPKTSAYTVTNNLEYKLGFKSPKRAVDITIRFKRGVSHTSWTSPKSSINDVARLAALLIKGYKAKAYKGGTSGGSRGTPSVRFPARPIFTNYKELYGDEMRQIVINAFRTYSHWGVAQRAERAGKAIIRDMQRKVYSGSLGLAANQGKYAAKKAARYGDVPFVATKALMEHMEVVIQ